jgi:hypothetical protein
MPLGRWRWLRREEPRVFASNSSIDISYALHVFGDAVRSSVSPACAGMRSAAGLAFGLVARHSCHIPPRSDFLPRVYCTL